MDFQIDLKISSSGSNWCRFSPVTGETTSSVALRPLSLPHVNFCLWHHEWREAGVPTPGRDSRCPVGLTLGEGKTKTQVSGSTGGKWDGVHIRWGRGSTESGPEV